MRTPRCSWSALASGRAVDGETCGNSNGLSPHRVEEGSCSRFVPLELMNDQPLNPKRIRHDGQNPIGSEVLDLHAARKGHCGDMRPAIVEAQPELFRPPGRAKVPHPD